jgi:hypothetical protein
MQGMEEFVMQESYLFAHLDGQLPKSWPQMNAAARRPQTKEHGTALATIVADGILGANMDSLKGETVRGWEPQATS